MVCRAAKKHTSISEEQIIRMVLDTLCSTGELKQLPDIADENIVFMREQKVIL